MAIEAILSDVGGVTIANYDVAPDVKRRVGMTDEKFDAVWPSTVKLYGSGRIDELQLWEALARSGGEAVLPDENILTVGFRENLTIHEKTLRLMRAFGKAGGKLAILSDTIPNHARVLRDAHVYDNFDAGIFLSCQTGYRKDDITAYEHAVESLAQQHHLAPENILFIDDKPTNLLLAQELSMQTVLAVGSDEAIANTLKAELAQS